MTVQESIEALPAAAGPQVGSRPMPGTLPSVRTALGTDQVLARLDSAARRGRLPGFARCTGENLFKVVAYGEPLDHDLFARAEGHGAAGFTLHFSLRMLRKLPIIFWVMTAVTVWPGVWLTDSMLRTYFDWYRFATWMWYIPLTVLPIPWMWARWVGRSRTAAHESAVEQIASVAKELGGEVCAEG